MKSFITFAGAIGVATATISAAPPTYPTETTTGEVIIDTLLPVPDCQTNFDRCVNELGLSEDICGCELTRCFGQDNARERERCAALTGTPSAPAYPTTTASVPTYPTTTASVPTYPATTPAVYPTTTKEVPIDTLLPVPDCQANFDRCVNELGLSEDICGCELTRCFGQDNARERERCAALTSSVASSYPTHYPTHKTTTVISTSKFETYCPEPTTLTFNTKTYVVTSAKTLTVTDCHDGCTVTKKVPSAYPTGEHTIDTLLPVPTTHAYPTGEHTIDTLLPVPYPTGEHTIDTLLPVPSTHTVPYPTGPATVPVVKPSGTGVHYPEHTTPVVYDGAATRVGAGALLAVAGLVAAL